MNRRVLLGSLVVAAGSRLAADEPLAPVLRPEVTAGPFKLCIDRILQSRSVVTTYRADGSPMTEQSRSLQVHMAVYARDPGDAARLAALQVRGLTAETGGRVIDVSHNGGLLENPDDTASIRAYVYIQSFPRDVREIRSLFGEVVAFERSTPLEIDVPIKGDDLSNIGEKEGVRVTVRELTREGNNWRVRILATSSSSAVVLNAVQDGAYGVSLLNAQGKAAEANGGTLIQSAATQAQYLVVFSGLQGEPATVRLRIASRGGVRRVHPFKMEHIPLPERTAPLPAPR